MRAWLLALWIPNVALADGWYIRWDCVGQCEGYGAGNSGVIGPFGNEADCEHERHNNLVIPEDSLFHHFCEYVGPPPPSYTPAPYSPPPYTPSGGGGGESGEVRMVAMDLAVLGGPGWTATDLGGAHAGAGSAGFELDTHFGQDWGGAAVQLGMTGTRLRAPLLGSDARTWGIGIAAVGLVLNPRLFGLGEGRSLWLDAGASVGGFATLGCGDCEAPVFDDDFGWGYQFKVGFDVLFQDEAGLTFDVVLPRYATGSAAVGDLLLESPPWMIRVGTVVRGLE